MAFYRDHIYPILVDKLGDPPPIKAIRQQIIHLAQGQVLEIGAGSGANFSHYDTTRVTKLYALEPNAGMIRLANEQRRRTSLNIEFLGLPGERIPLGDQTVDTVVSTFTLCTIPDIKDALEPDAGMIRLANEQRRRTNLNIEFLGLPGERIPLGDQTVDTVVSTFTLCTIPDIKGALQGIARVLKPDGKIIFFELGLAPDPSVQRWQRLLEPIHHLFFQGLYLTRDIPSLLRKFGFQIDQMEKGYLARFPKSATYCWWGMAQSTRQ